MLCSRLCTTLLLAATCLLMRAGFSRAQKVTIVTPSSAERVITCDGAFNVHRLSCANGVISVQTALYGRADSTTCSEGKLPQELSNTKCSLQGTLDIMRNRCNGTRVCEINTDTFVTSDPCPGIYKYLETTYTCLPAIFSVACDGSLSNLQCPGGQFISVYGAYIGRRDTTTCSYQRPASEIQNVDCSVSTSKVGQSCNRKRSCAIKASSSVLEDPCVGTYKYLEVAYTCKNPGS